jgi:hypothetical protein
MKIMGLCASWILFCSSAAIAAAPATLPATEPDAADDSGLVIAYAGPPPSEGNVTTRTEAEGGRCVSDPSIVEYAFGPESTGLTTSAHPKLVWYLNKPLDLKVEINLTDPQRHTTVHLWESSTRVPAGIHILDTSNSTPLELGVEYKWTVQIVNDPSDPSKDMYSTGMIRRVEPSDPNAASHAFYDAMGASASKLVAARTSGDAGRTADAQNALSQLLTLANLPAIEEFSASVDTGK